MRCVYCPTTQRRSAFPYPGADGRFTRARWRFAVRSSVKMLEPTLEGRPSEPPSRSRESRTQAPTRHPAVTGYGARNGCRGGLAPNDFIEKSLACGCVCWRVGAALRRRQSTLQAPMSVMEMRHMSIPLPETMKMHWPARRCVRKRAASSHPAGQRQARCHQCDARCAAVFLPLQSTLRHRSSLEINGSALWHLAMHACQVGLPTSSSEQ